MEHTHVSVSAPSSTESNATRWTVYACRHCRDAVKVSEQRYLPEQCPGCGAATWDEGRCTSPGGCSAVRRPGIRGRAECHVCGHSVWLMIRVEDESRLWPSSV